MNYLLFLGKPVGVIFLDFFVGPELKVVATLSSGTDNINTFECQRRGIDVCKTPDIAADAAADIAVALILMTSRKIVQGRSKFLLRKRLLMVSSSPRSFPRMGRKKGPGDTGENVAIRKLTEEISKLSQRLPQRKIPVLKSEIDFDSVHFKYSESFSCMKSYVSHGS